MSKTVIEWSLTFGIGLLLATAMFYGFTEISDARHERVSEQHLEHIGRETAVLMTHIHDAGVEHNTEQQHINDLGGTSTSFQSSIVVDEPPEVNGESYTVQVSKTGDELVLEDATASVEKRVPLPDRVDAKPLTGGIGGQLLITYNDTDDTVRLDSERTYE